MRAMARLKQLILVVIVLSALAACQSPSQSTPIPTEIALVRRIATLAPTPTIDPNAQILLPTSTPTITPIPSATAYVGVFAGEVSAADNILVPRRESGGVDPVQSVEVVTAINCQIPIDTVFGVSWQDEPRAVNGLGCPLQQSFGFDGRVQVFEGGIMYLRESTNEVWAIAPGGLAITGQHWSVTQQPGVVPVGPTAPEGFFVPEGVIGSVWATVPDARDELGFASTQLQRVEINIQRFDGGTLFLDVTTGQVFALLVNGIAYGPY